MAEHQRNQEATIYCGNLDDRVKDELLFELMLQAGPVVNVHIPKDRVMQSHQGYGFCEFLTEEDAEYACKIMNQVKLFGKPLRVNKASSDKKQTVDIGAELFVGNLDAMVDEKVLYETFSRFGVLLKPPILQRNEQGLSKGFGFVNFDSFEAADQAIEAMNNQFLMNKSISVTYAFKSGGKGEKHGDDAERLLAKQAKRHNVQLVPLTPGMGAGSAPQQLGAIAPAMPVPQGFAGGYAVVGGSSFPPPPPPLSHS